MHRADLAKAIADELGDEKGRVDRIVKTTFEKLAAALDGGEAVTIQGFGRFARKTRAARTSRNPATGEPIQVAAKSVITFHPAPATARQTA